MNEVTNITPLPLTSIFSVLFNGRPLNEVLIIILFIGIFGVAFISLFFFIGKKFKIDFLPWLKVLKKNEAGNENTLIVNVNTKEEGREEIKIKNEEDEFGNKKNDENCEEEDYSNLVLVISKSLLFGEEIFKEQEITLVRSQMSVVEAKLNLIKSAFLKDYMELLYKKRGFGIDINNDPSYIIFSNVVHINVHRTMILMIRQKIKENHLAKYSDERFEIYIEMNRDTLLNDILISFNTSLPAFIDPGKEDINKLIEKRTNYMASIFKDMFLETRAISQESQIFVKEKTRIFDEEIKRLTGLMEAHIRINSRQADEKKK